MIDVRTTEPLDLEHLLGFVDLYFAIAVPEGTAPEVHPRFVAERIARDHGQSRAMAGTRAAINDIVEMTFNLRPEEVKGFDIALSEEGLPTLSRLRRLYSSRYARILRRNEIRTEDEYRMVKNMLDDVSLDIAPEESERLVAMMEAYEI